MQILDIIFNDNSKLIVDYEVDNSIQMQYIKERKKCLNMLNFIFNKFRFNDNSFYYAVSYMDRILLQNPSLNFELVVIISFILSSIYII